MPTPCFDHSRVYSKRIRHLSTRQKSCLRLYKLTQSGLADGRDLAEAIKLQGIVSRADWALQKVGIAGTKYALDRLRGYGGSPRRPMLGYRGDGEALMESLDEILQLEKTL